MAKVASGYAAPSVISARLRIARLARGFSQQRLAKEAKIDQQQLSRMERAEPVSLRLSDFLAVCCALNVSANAFLSVEESDYLDELSPGESFGSFYEIHKADIVIGRLPSGHRCILKHRHSPGDADIDQTLELAKQRGWYVVFVERSQI